jgi:hypothetical protein
VNVSALAKAALFRNFLGSTDNRGYTKSPQENLLSGVDLANWYSKRRSSGRTLLVVRADVLALMRDAITQA